MPIRTTFDLPPAGVTLTSALPGEEVRISVKAYLSSDDGVDFIKHLEAIWGFFEEAIRPAGVLPSQVDHFLALIRPDLTATLYCNELQQRALVRAKGPVQAGQRVFKDDIADIDQLVFQDSGGQEIQIPADNGVVLINSVRWRKCLYYDFEVLMPDGQPRQVDLPKLFGMFYQQLLFQEMHSITEEQWERMFEWGWFPFVWLSGDARNKVIQFSSRSEQPLPLFEEICREFQGVLQQRIASWQRVELMREHEAFIQKATDHYLQGDFISAIQVLYPRLEGIMRTLHLIKKPGEAAGQKTMVESLVADQNDYSLFLPARFRDYLLRFYFQSFDQASGNVPLSRHTVSHGVSRPEDYDFIKASLGFMICDQIFYFLVALPESPS